MKIKEGILSYFRSNKHSSASLAKERLQIIVAHERVRNRPGQGDDQLIKELQRKIIDLISSELKIAKHEFVVDLARDNERSILELNVTLPNA